MDPNNVYFVLSDDEEPAPKRRNLGTENPDKDAPPGLTAIGGAGKASKNRKAKLPDGPIARPLDIFPLGAQGDPPPPIPHPSNTIDQAAMEMEHLKSCLRKVRELFPDVCKKHVTKLYGDRMKGVIAFRRHQNDLAKLDPSPLIVEQLLDDGDYPKEKDLERKRKRGDASGAGEKAPPIELVHDAEKSPGYFHSA